MKAPLVTRKIELFALHAHLAGNENVDYDAVFAALIRIPPDQRVYVTNNRAFAIGDISRNGARFRFSVYEGPLGANPVIFALQRAEVRTESLARDEFVADVTHVLVDVLLRRAAVEYVRRGAKADDVARTVTEVLRRTPDYSATFEISFSPVIEEGFIKKIDQFERIREADITVTRPNAGWTDHYTDLSSLLEDSGGENADLGIRAGRGRSLKKQSGVIKLIADVVADAHPYLKKAAIKGVRKGEAAETTLTSNKHLVHAVARIEQDGSGRVSETQLFHNMEGLIRSDDRQLRAAPGSLADD